MANRRLEEIKLLALCMASDNRDAFSRLVEIHQQGLRRFLLNLTNGNEALTDDLAQETFLKAWLAVRSFHGLLDSRPGFTASPSTNFPPIAVRLPDMTSPEWTPATWS